MSEQPATPELQMERMRLLQEAGEAARARDACTSIQWRRGQRAYLLGSVFQGAFA